jgi:hypothetical protein
MSDEVPTYRERFERKMRGDCEWCGTEDPHSLDELSRCFPVRLAFHRQIAVNLESQLAAALEREKVYRSVCEMALVVGRDDSDVTGLTLRKAASDALSQQPTATEKET